MTVTAMAQNNANLRARGEAIAAVLFDWDCTLLDSRAALLGAWHESTEAVVGRRFPVTEAEEQIVFTQPGREIWPTITQDTAERERLVTRFQEAYESSGRSVRSFAGVPEALRALKDAGVAIAVVTSKARRRFALDAARASLEDLIDVAVCSEDVDAAKPDPRPVLKGLELLGVSAQAALMVGDTVVDIAAGLAAGTRAIGVGWGASPETELRRAGAEAVVQTPSELVTLVLESQDPAKGTSP